MKKLFMGIATVAVAACMLTGCGENEEESLTEEERFNTAKQSFDNYTVTIDFSTQEGDPFQHKWEIDGTACRYTRIYYNTTIVYTYKQENGKVYFYEGPNEGWSYEECSKINDLLMDGESGYVYYFQEFFYDDFKKDGEYLKMTDSALEGYSAKLGSSTTLSSAKLKLDGSHFDSAIAVIQSGTSRTQLEYKFTNYGTTTVNLPN